MGPRAEIKPPADAIAGSRRAIGTSNSWKRMWRTSTAGLKAKPGVGIQFGAGGDTPLGEWVDPGVAWDLPQRRVYVVHADGDVVSSVDLDTLDREVHDFGAPSGVRALFPGWFARSASAKGPTLGVRRQAVLSPDSRHLYVTGVRLLRLVRAQLIEIVVAKRAEQFRVGPPASRRDRLAKCGCTSGVQPDIADAREVQGA